MSVGSKLFLSKTKPSLWGVSECLRSYIQGSGQELECCRCSYRMSSKKKIEANRRNALKSCGPRSSAGKLIASQNARKYGYFSTHILLADEDRNQYFRMARGVVEQHTPVGAFEAELVVTIIQTLWQLRRSNLVDTELFAMYRFYENEERGVGTAFANDAAQANSFSKLIRYQAHLLRKLALVKKELSELQERRSLVMAQASPALERGKLNPSKEILG